jgi:outer membrane protein OmpA-like peptidoglycan-associated protein
MKKFLCAVSIVALQLAFTPTVVMAEGEGTNVVPQQAQVPADVLKLLKDNTPLSKLTDDQLNRRFRLARGASRNGQLPEKTRDQLARIAKETRVEMQRRETAAEDPVPAKKKVVEVEEEPAPKKKPVKEARVDEEDPDPEVKPDKKGRVVTEVQEEEPAPEKRPVKQAEVEAAGRIPREVRSLLSDDRSRRDIRTQELSDRVKLAFRYSRDEDLPGNVRQRLAAMSKEDRAELLRRENKQTAEREEEPEIIVKRDKPREAPREIIVDARDEIDPSAEREARQLLNDGVNVRGLESRRLSRRLNTMRELLATNALDPRTAREMRRRIAQDREVLRDRVALEQAEEDQVAGKTRPPKAIIVGRSDNSEIRIVLGDRRRSDDLTREELDRRIKVYRDIESDPGYYSYDEFERRRWREVLVSDREILRRRLLREREERSGELTLELNRGKLDIELGVDVPTRQPRDVFVAEADDEEIEEILVAPPAAKPRRRYTVDEIAEEPEVRKSLPRVEIDTVKFGFNEAFVREEEVGNLDRIAAVMERILKKYPREVFMIEGHTDAVGSDAYNQALSRQRAEAIKRALITYYVLPPESLRTVGLGERYLKIPTPEAEAENRRVSIARVTQYVSSAE